MATNNKVYKNKDISKSTKSKIKKLQREILRLEIENAELRDKLIRYGENPNQLSFDFEINKISDNDFEVKKPMIYESPDGGKTIYGRRAGDSVREQFNQECD
jgi:hypothetical protein